MIDGVRLSITASIGVVEADASTPAAILLRNADIALNRAKDAGRNQISHYTPSMTAAREERFQLEQSLRDAVGSKRVQAVVSADHRGRDGRDHRV